MSVFAAADGQSGSVSGSDVVPIVAGVGSAATLCTLLATLLVLRWKARHKQAAQDDEKKHVPGGVLEVSSLHILVCLGVCQV